VKQTASARADESDAEPEAAKVLGAIDEGKLERQVGDVTLLGEKQPGHRVRLGARRGNTEPFLVRSDLQMKRDARLGIVGGGIGPDLELNLCAC
jgi:hypothetical protein